MGGEGGGARAESEPVTELARVFASKVCRCGLGGGPAVASAAAARDMGIIAKRPIANAAWLFSRWRVGDYEKPYWRRLKKLSYDFLRSDPRGAVETALRFTLSVSGVDTAIVGTTRPSRWAENAAIAANGVLARSRFDAIRARWLIAANSDWVGLR